MKRSTTTAYSNDPERFHLSLFIARLREWDTQDLIYLEVEAQQERKYHDGQQEMVDQFRRAAADIRPYAIDMFPEWVSMISYSRH